VGGSIFAGLKSLFRLPVVILVRHPLRFAIGHVVHGGAMRTAWTTTTPTSIYDRNDNLLNLKMETALEDYAISNFPEVKYDRIRAETKEIKLPESIWMPATAEGVAAEMTPAIGEEDDESNEEDLQAMRDEAMQQADEQGEDEEEDVNEGGSPLGQ